MPTVLRSGPYRIYFYSHESTEPPHVHVDRDDLTAKVWLTPARAARNLGFSTKELRRIMKIIEENESLILGAWNEHLGSRG